jgi:hypothetical protein
VTQIADQVLDESAPVFVAGFVLEPLARTERELCRTVRRRRRHSGEHVGFGGHPEVTFRLLSQAFVTRRARRQAEKAPHCGARAPHHGSLIGRMRSTPRESRCHWARSSASRRRPAAVFRPSEEWSAGVRGRVA